MRNTSWEGADSIVFGRTFLELDSAQLLLLVASCTQLLLLVASETQLLSAFQSLISG